MNRRVKLETASGEKEGDEGTKTVEDKDRLDATSVMAATLEDCRQRNAQLGSCPINYMHTFR